MSARFLEAPDSWGDPCLWEARVAAPRCVISKYDLNEDYRDSLWPLIVKAVASA